jgi:hypothetical protein
MIGYQVPAKIRRAAPARWLDHTLRQMKAKNGHYRRITRQAKRDWHKLLIYNEHDCLGMRAVILRAARELEPSGWVGRPTLRTGQ